MQKKSAETILYSTVGILVMLGIVVLINVLAGTVRARVDMTQEKAYTLSAGTKAILKKLDTPVTIRFYCTHSETATPETVYLRGYARRVEDLLAEYKEVAGKNLVIEKFDPQPDSDAEDSARLDGLEPQQLPGVDQFYLGLAVKLADQVETIPFLRPNQESLLEYQISRAIARVQQPDKPVLGVMSALPVFGAPANPMMMQMGQQGTAPWTIINDLQADYTVRRVNLDTDKIDDDIKVLLVIYPKGVSDKTQFAIDQFIMRGGKLVAFLDPQSVTENRNQNPMMGNMDTGGGASLDKLIKAWGLEFDTTKVVADLDYKLKLRGRNNQPEDAPAWLALDGDAINKNDVATSQVGSIWLPLCGAFTGTPAAGLTETVLLQSSKDSKLVEGFLANMSNEAAMNNFSPSGVRYKLAVQLTGKFKTAFPNGAPEEPKDEAKTDEEKKADAEKKAAEKTAEKKPDNSLKETKGDNTVVLVGDSDMLFDPFTLQRVDTLLGSFAQPLNANLAFAENILEQVSGDANLIAIRSRASTSRPFTRIQQLEAAARARGQSKLDALQASLQETQRKLTELQQQRSDKDQRFILSPEQRTEVENFRKQEAQTSKELKQVQKDLRKEVVSLETWVKWINILAMPLTVTATGIVIAVYKRRKTAAK